MYNYQQPQPNYYGAPNTMYAPQQMPVAKMTQVLTKEQINELKRNNAAFNLSIDPLELTRSLCTHKDPNTGQIALNYIPETNEVTCEICGKTFELLNKDKQEVEQITKMFLDVLETIKTYYVDIPADYVTQIFQIEPLLEKIPGLYQVALNNFKKYDRSAGFNQNNGNLGGFNLYGAITGNGYATPYSPVPYGAAQAPYGAPAPVPGMEGFSPVPYGAPQVQPQYATAPQAGYNPFSMPAPPQGYQQPQVPYGAPQVQPQYAPAPQGYAPQGTQQQCTDPNHQHVQQQQVVSTDRVSTTKAFKE